MDNSKVVDRPFYFSNTKFRLFLFVVLFRKGGSKDGTS